MIFLKNDRSLDAKITKCALKPQLSFLLELSSSKSDITRKPEAIVVPGRNGPAIDEVNARKRKVLSDSPAGVQALQSFSSHHLLLIADIFQDLRLNEIVKDLKVSMQSQEWWGRIYSIEVDNLLAKDSRLQI